MTDLNLLPTKSFAASESTSANLSEAALVDGADLLSFAPDPLLARILYLRASAASDIAKGNIITVAGSTPAPCTLNLLKRSPLELGLLGDIRVSVGSSHKALFCLQEIVAGGNSWCCLHVALHCAYMLHPLPSVLLRLHWTEL